MKPFTLDSSMTSIRGDFYPTGHVVLMLPGREAVEKAADLLREGGIGGDEMMMLTPDDIHGKIARTVGNADIPLPSAGTEGDTVRRFAELASQGHHGLMVRAPDSDDSERVMQLLKDQPIAYGQKYRMLVIEDLV